MTKCCRKMEIKNKREYMKQVKRNYILDLMLLLVAFCFSTGVLFGQDQDASLDEGFEDGNTDGWKYVGALDRSSKPLSHSLNFVSSPVREGNKALRFELRQSDPDSNIGSKRIQLEGSQGAKAGKREVWHSFSIFLPNDYTKDPSSEILWEMHSIPDGFPSKQIEPWRSAPLELMTENGVWRVNWRWDSRKLTPFPDAGSWTPPEGSKSMGLGAYQTGRWVDLVVHVKWSFEADGLLEVFKNGEKIISEKGPIGYNDDKAPYQKIGIYKWQWMPNQPSWNPVSTTTKRVVYFDKVNSYLGTSNTVKKPISQDESVLLFKSGFEQGVTIERAEVTGGEWWSKISGSDLGYDWAGGLPQNATSRFQYLVGGRKALKNNVETNIQTVVGHDGNPTRALFMKVVADDPDYVAITRSQFNFRMKPEMTQGYCSYWLKFQPDLETLMPNDGKHQWKNFMEWRETGTGRKHDYRIELLVNRDDYFHPSGKTDLFWTLRAQQKDNPIKRDGLEWDYKNEKIPVIIGKWFKLEVFWKLSEGNDGRILVKVDGQELFDHHGPTRKDSELRQLNIFKLYTGKNSLSRAPAKQWIDDFELWSGIPGSSRNKGTPSAPSVPTKLHLAIENAH